MTARGIALAGMLLLIAGCGGDDDGGGRQDTPTATASPIDTPTATPTATLPPSATPTPTSTALPTETPTPTSTPTATVGATPLGTRVFAISAPTGGLGASPDVTRTGFFGTPLNGNSVATAFFTQDLVLVAGSPDAGGVASLRLQSDAYLAVPNPVDVVCVRIIAEGSFGEIDCDGGTAYSVRLQQEGGDVGPSGEPETALGDDSGAGAANLRVVQESVRLPAGATLEECITATYDPPTVTVYTTALATATKGEKTLSVAGENFDCNAFAEPDSGGMLAGPLLGFVTNPPLGDVGYVVRLGGSPRVSP